MEVNDAYVKRYGYSRDELIGSWLTDITVWDDLNERYNFVEQIKQNGFINNFEVRFHKKTGEVLTVLLSGVTIIFNGEKCTLGISSDITKLKRYQLEIARLDRLNLVGEMSASISHEIRNPMTTVRGFLQLLRGKDRYAQDIEYMDLMIEELDRTNSIITEFLSLAKNKAVELKRQSLNEKINDLFPLLQADALKQDKNIKLELGDIPYINFDKNEIRQLILNLVRNGFEAMLPGGFLTIKTFKDDDRFTLAVQDQGTGLAPDVLEKIGTPFFTTKENGTGLGLAICYSIAHRHNAKIDINCEVRPMPSSPPVLLMTFLSRSSFELPTIK
jgi:PAS domain S-box-containing protein